MAATRTKLTARARALRATQAAPRPRRAPAAAGSLETLLRAVMLHWPGILFRQRPDLTFELTAGNLAELTGIPAARWQQDPGVFLQIIHELDQEEVRRQIAHAAEVEDGLTHRFRIRQALTGRVRHLAEFRRVLRSATGEVLAYEGYWLEVTRETLAERRLAGAAWKETLGLLTLGLAHDFNNLLAGIQGLSDTFLAQVPPDHPFCQGLALVKRNTQRGAQLIQRMAQLHRSQTGARGYHNLNDIVRDNLDLLRKVLPKTITLEDRLAPEPLPLYVDPVELQQILINLALNAAQAMGAGGTLTLQTSAHAHAPDAPFGQGVGTIPRAPMICLSVSDTGSGIKPHFREALFDPYFTTKAMNRGSGLGLYNARLFVEKHQGAITLESQEGAGSSLRVWLPQADFTEAERAFHLSRQRPRTILVVGAPGRRRDETAEFLRQHHYQIVAGGTDVADLIGSGDYDFDGVLLQTTGLDDQGSAEFLQYVRGQSLRLKLILDTVGRHPDEVPTTLAAKADLVISADTPAETIPKRLAELFEP